MTIFMWLFLGGLMAFTSLSTDIYLPAMPQMSLDLNGSVELALTGFLGGFAFAQILWGPISDRFGRKLPLFLGIILFAIGSAGCALSRSIATIIFFRIIQAFGACVGPMLSRAIVRDMFEGAKAAEILSTLMVLMAVAPIIGPLFGGQILKFSSWHTIFVLLVAFGVLMLVLLKKLPETLPRENRLNSSTWGAFRNYAVLLKNRRFMKYTLCVTFFYIAAYAFIAGSPSIYITHFGVKPQNYGWLFALNILGVMSLGFVNRYFVRRFSLDFLLKVATTISMLAGITLMIFVKLDFGGLYGVVIPIFFFFSMNGIISATTSAAALDLVPHIAGSGAALLGALQYSSGVLSTILLTWYTDGSGDPWTMSWIIALFAILAAVVIRIKK